MLQHREFVASRAKTSRVTGRLEKVVVTVVVPLLRVVCRVVPPLGRALARTTGGLQGAVFRNRDRGDHRVAYTAALEGVARQRRAGREGHWLRDMDELQWWMFLDLAAREAEHLGEAERAHVVELLEAAPTPGGMVAAWCMARIAGWRWTSRDRDGAITMARRAIAADPSWPHSHILLGLFGLLSGRFDPLPHLREALAVDASCAESIRTNRAFVQAPGLMRSLGFRASGGPEPNERPWRA